MVSKCCVEWIPVTNVVSRRQVGSADSPGAAAASRSHAEVCGKIPSTNVMRLTNSPGFHALTVFMAYIVWSHKP